MVFSESKKRTAQSCRERSKSLSNAKGTRPETCPVFSENGNKIYCIVYLPPDSLYERRHTSPFIILLRSYIDIHAYSWLDSTIEDDSMNEIIPSLEGLLDQLHNIKPHQFYENQRKLKLYDLQFLCDELETRKQNLFREVDAIINWYSFFLVFIQLATSLVIIRE